MVNDISKKSFDLAFKFGNFNANFANHLNFLDCFRVLEIVRRS